jgi:hypothetical protein
MLAAIAMGCTVTIVLVVAVTMYVVAIRLCIDQVVTVRYAGEAEDGLTHLAVFRRRETRFSALCFSPVSWRSVEEPNSFSVFVAD